MASNPRQQQHMAALWLTIFIVICAGIFMTVFVKFELDAVHDRIDNISIEAQRGMGVTPATPVAPVCGPEGCPVPDLIILEEQSPEAGGKMQDTMSGAIRHDDGDEHDGPVCPACGWPLNLYTEGKEGKCNHNGCDNTYWWDKQGGEFEIVWEHFIPRHLR